MGKGMLRITARRDASVSGIKEQPFAGPVNDWLEQERLRVKRSTYSLYCGAARRHIIPELGDLPVRHVTPERLSAFIEFKRALAPSTLRIICHILRSALELARDQGMPVAAPSSLYMPQRSPSEARVLDQPDQTRLVETLYQNLDRPRLGMLLCLYTGLRLGEICALKWGDLAPDCSSLCIRRTVQRIAVPNAGDGPRTMVVFDSPKSARSNRRIPVPPAISRELLSFRGEEEEFILTGSSKSFLEPRAFQRRFKTVLRHAELDDINFHALRHTFATNCINLGCDPTTLSRMLGHSDVSITLNTYVHTSFDSMRAFMDRMDAAL